MLRRRRMDSRRSQGPQRQGMLERAHGVLSRRSCRQSHVVHNDRGSRVRIAAHRVAQVRRRSARSGGHPRICSHGRTEPRSCACAHAGPCRRRRVPLEYHSAALAPMRTHAAAAAGVSARGSRCLLRSPALVRRPMIGRACRCEQAARHGLYEVLELHPDVAKHISFSLELCGSRLLPRYSSGTEARKRGSQLALMRARSSQLCDTSIRLLQVRGRSQTAGVHP